MQSPGFKPGGFSPPPCPCPHWIPQSAADQRTAVIAPDIAPPAAPKTPPPTAPVAVPIMGNTTVPPVAPIDAPTMPPAIAPPASPLPIFLPSPAIHSQKQLSLLIVR